MTKFAIITDTHFGARGDSEAFLDYQKRFLDDIFFPYLRKNKINDVIHLGDLVDRRKYINFQTAKRMREDFILPLWDKNVHFIAGNHDVYYRSTNQINVYSELLQGYDHKVYLDTNEVIIDDETFLFVPWINPENQTKSLDLISKTKAQICMGHLELVGFEAIRGHTMDHGMSPSLFDKFDVVMSGHYHYKSSKGNIHYLGSPYQMNWGDFGDPRGFHIFDTKTRKIEFIENTYSLFSKFFYNDAEKDKSVLKKELDKTQIDGVYCKVIVENKTDPYIFDWLIAEIEKKNPLDLKIVEAQEVFSRDYVEEDTKVEDTLTVLRSSVRSVDVEDAKKKQLETLMVDLYNQAQVNQI